MALDVKGRKPIFAFSSAIAVINAVVGGAAVAVALGAIADVSLGIAAAVGGVAALVSVVGWIRYADRLLDARAVETKPLLPS